MLKKIISIFKKERIACIVWDGKTMSYPHLTQKQINDINTNPKYEGWSVTLRER